MEVPYFVQKDTHVKIPSCIPCLDVNCEYILMNVILYLTCPARKYLQIDTVIYSHKFQNLLKAPDVRRLNSFHNHDVRTILGFISGRDALVLNNYQDSLACIDRLQFQF